MTISIINFLLKNYFLFKNLIVCENYYNCKIKFKPIYNVFLLSNVYKYLNILLLQ